MTLADFQSLPIRDAHALATELRECLREDRRSPLGVVLEEVVSRLGYLVEAGLGYLTLDRKSGTLAGGEQPATDAAAATTPAEAPRHRLRTAAGDEVDVLARDDASGWWWCRRADGAAGWVPIDALDPLE